MIRTHWKFAEVAARHQLLHAVLLDVNLQWQRSMHALGQYAGHPARGRPRLRWEHLLDGFRMQWEEIDWVPLARINHDVAWMDVSDHFVA